VWVKKCILIYFIFTRACNVAHSSIKYLLCVCVCVCVCLFVCVYLKTLSLKQSTCLRMRRRLMPNKLERQLKDSGVASIQLDIYKNDFKRKESRTTKTTKTHKISNIVFLNIYRLAFSCAQRFGKRICFLHEIQRFWMSLSRRKKTKSLCLLMQL
jgi:hypothetical protein